MTTDMLKADVSMSEKCMVELFNKVWTEEGVPKEWQKGVISHHQRLETISNLLEIHKAITHLLSYVTNL